jgi:hypothetical protein
VDRGPEHIAEFDPIAGQDAGLDQLADLAGHRDPGAGGGERII